MNPMSTLVVVLFTSRLYRDAGATPSPLPGSGPLSYLMFGLGGLLI